MKIIVVGGSGTIGRAVVENLKSDHEIVIAGRGECDVKVDMLDESSIENMYKEVGAFDAMVSTAGALPFLPLEKFTSNDFEIGLKDKLMGQVNLVTHGMKHINDGGSFTLTSGVLSKDPIKFGTCASMVNRALDGFVVGSAIEMPRGLRINVVSPTVLTESLEGYGPYFEGFVSVDASKVAMAYRKSVMGLQTGQVYEVL